MSKKSEAPISAFAFNVGRQIESLINERTNNLERDNNMLKGQILSWYAKKKDPEFAEFFGITKVK